MVVGPLPSTAVYIPGRRGRHTNDNGVYTAYVMLIWAPLIPYNHHGLSVECKVFDKGTATPHSDSDIMMAGIIAFWGNYFWMNPTGLSVE